MKKSKVPNDEKYVFNIFKKSEIDKIKLSRDAIVLLRELLIFYSGTNPNIESKSFISEKGNLKMYFLSLKLMSENWMHTPRSMARVLDMLEYTGIIFKQTFQLSKNDTKNKKDYIGKKLYLFFDPRVLKQITELGPKNKYLSPHIKDRLNELIYLTESQNPDFKMLDNFRKKNNFINVETIINKNISSRKVLLKNNKTKTIQKDIRKKLNQKENKNVSPKENKNVSLEPEIDNIDYEELIKKRDELIENKITPFPKEKMFYKQDEISTPFIFEEEKEDDIYDDEEIEEYDYGE